MKISIRLISLLCLFSILLISFGCGSQGDPLDDMYTSDILPGEASTYNIGSEHYPYNEAWFDEVYIDGIPYPHSAYAEVYITTPLVVTCTTADTDYRVNGMSVTSEISEFEANGQRITYTADHPHVFRIAAMFSVSSDTNNVICTWKVFKNGAAHNASITKRKIATAGDIGSQGIASLIEMDTNDYVEIYISTDDNNVNITVENMTFTISRIG